MEAHGQWLMQVRQQYSSPVWYLEIVAAHPSYQGQGLGSLLLKSVLAVSEGDVIVLECTDKKNLPFYEKFGFVLVDEQVLDDGGDSVKVFKMIRESEAV